MRKRGNFLSKKIISGILSCIVIILLLIFAPEVLDEPSENISDTKYTDYPLCVSFIDVGQADCELITCNGINILVDGGEASSADAVLEYLRANSIDKIDCYILTHPHSDHIGAAAEIIESVECDKVFTTYFSEFNVPTSYLYENLIDTVYEFANEAVAVEAGESYSFGDLEIDILAPIIESDDYNEMSIVFTATYKDTSVLFTGDTTVPVEKQMIENGLLRDVDLIKIAHHGSSTSNSAEFIEAVNPEIAVISCGKNNSYGHPHRETINLLNDLEITYFRTDYSGTVVYYGDGKNMSIGELG